MYINDLAIGVKGMNCGIDIDGLNLSILLYADDIVIMVPDEKKLQDMLDLYMNGVVNGKCLSTKKKIYISIRKDISILILNGSLEMLSWKQKKFINISVYTYLKIWILSSRLICNHLLEVKL